MSVVKKKYLVGWVFFFGGERGRKGDNYLPLRKCCTVGKSDDVEN